jgi:hypothetical protein
MHGGSKPSIVNHQPSTHLEERTAPTSHDSNDGIVQSLKESLGIVQKEIADMDTSSSVDARSSAIIASPRFMRAKVKTIELPTYSNGKVLERKNRPLKLKHVVLPTYDNSKPLRRQVVQEEQNQVRFKSKISSTAEMKFPDSSKLKWHGWVKKSKERVKNRVAKAIHVHLDD